MSTTINSIISPRILETPILLLIFNRLETTKEVFNSIKEAKPAKLYIASDAARKGENDEAKVVNQVRNYVVDNIDWDCKVETLFRQENLGCKYAVSSAIDWFFENEEMGIILEDDCLPSLSFFWFCQNLLNFYKEDTRIWHISGNNFHFNWKNAPQESYYFGGIYGSIWGWATWRDRWEKYDVEMKDFKRLNDEKYFDNCYDGSDAVKSRIKDFKLIIDGLDTWDYQWVYTRWLNNGLTIVPNINLVSNIGFGKEATHTFSKKDKRANMKAFSMSFPLQHPKEVKRDSVSELKFYKSFGQLKTMDKLKIRIKQILKI